MSEKPAYKLPLRLRGPQSRTTLGAIAACALPIGYGLMTLLEQMQRSRGFAEAVKHYTTTEDATIFETPILIIFLIGTVCVALLSLRAVRRRGRLFLPGLFGTAISRAAYVQFAFMIGQFAIIVFVVGDTGNFLHDIAVFFFFGLLMHLGLFALVTTPLAMLCAYIFRMVAMTRKPEHLTSTFD